MSVIGNLAILFSRMTSVSPSVPVKSFEDVLTKDYRIISLKDSASHAFLKLAHPGTKFTELS
jgi:hypothetical protein